jgi:hypothetical protein
MWMGGQSHTLAALPLGKRNDTHHVSDWVGPRVSLDGYGKSYPQWDLLLKSYLPWTSYESVRHIYIWRLYVRPNSVLTCSTKFIFTYLFLWRIRRPRYLAVSLLWFIDLTHKQTKTHGRTSLNEWARCTSGRTLALGSTQPREEMSICWRGKSGWCVGLATSPPAVTEIL